MLGSPAQHAIQLMLDRWAGGGAEEGVATHLILRLCVKASMLILSRRMKSPRPVAVWSAMVSLCRRPATD